MTKAYKHGAAVDAANSSADVYITGRCSETNVPYPVCLQVVEVEDGATSYVCLSKDGVKALIRALIETL